METPDTAAIPSLDGFSPTVQEIHVPTLTLDRFTSIVGEERASIVRDAAASAKAFLEGRVVWNVNSTGAGGGVAEMLQTLLGYARGAGVDARWLVIEGETGFFGITKRIHNGLHASTGDGGALGDAEQAHYAEVTARNATELCKLVRPMDIVILHDPQTAGMVSALRKLGAIVIWRCHIGADTTDPIVARTWEFLRPFLREVHAFIFTRAAYVPPWIDEKLVHFIPPSIDAFSTKNQPMDAPTARAILAQIGFLDPSCRNGATPEFTRNNGATALVERKASIIHSGTLPMLDSAIAVQVSRWDRLKDMLGVMQGFAMAGPNTSNAYLALVGPDVRAVTDDPEGAAVFAECMDAWQELPQPVRDRVLLILLPMDDIEENAAMVNAIQRFAAIVIQKSLHEGFGLTVTEAMWKGRPIIVSGVGGIQDQITNGEHGLVLSDPRDLVSFGSALERLFGDTALASRLGENARERCIKDFLGPRHLLQYVELFEKVAA
jgi:trehalose synthase